MLHYFNFALFFAALFNVALFCHFTIDKCNILILHYYFNIALAYLTLDECCTFPFCSVNIALLTLQVVLTITLIMYFLRLPIQCCVFLLLHFYCPIVYWLSVFYFYVVLSNFYIFFR